MDTVASINNLRAQFFRICPEKDQMSRIIKPYIPQTEKDAIVKYSTQDYDKVDPKISDVYTNPDGTYLLTEMESPPISKNFMDSYATIAKARLKKHNEEAYFRGNRTFNQGDLNNRVIETKDDGYNMDELKNENLTQVDGTLIEKSHNDFIANNTLKNNSISTSILNDDLSDNVVFENTSAKKKDARKSGLPFVRIFKNKKDSNAIPSKQNNTSSNSKNRKKSSSNSNAGKTDSSYSSVSNKSSRSDLRSKKSSQNIGNHRQTHTRRKSKFSMNFDFDENLEEEEEDEDEDEEGADLHSKFFRLDSNSSSQQSLSQNNEYTGSRAGSVLNNNGSKLIHGIQNSNNNNNNNNNNVTVNGGKYINDKFSNQNNKSKLHAGHSFVQKTTALDSGKSVSSMHGSLVNGAVQGLDGAAVNSVSANELKSVHSADDAISDLDSFIEAQNLEEMDFDAAGSDINKIVSNDSQRETHISDENGTSRLSLADDMNSISDASSYGKSLLGSDYSADELIKQDASTLDSASLMAATDMQTHTIPSNSIPMSIDKFGLYEGVDDSTINNVFGKAVQNLKTESSTEKKNVVPQMFFSSPSTANKAEFGTSANSTGKINTTPKSTQYRSRSNSYDQARYNRYDSRKIRKGSQSSVDRNKSNSSQSNGQSHKIELNDSLVIERRTDLSSAIPAVSQLSTLFKMQKQNAGNPLSALQYFSFVSGSKVAKTDVMQLEVYIQNSKKYKRDPFTVQIRKNSTVFEVIGFILYSYANDFKPPNFESDGLTVDKIGNPNNFSLSIVDEDGEPFEDNFGKLDRKSEIQTVSDNEVVLCEVDGNEKELNESMTPVPYDTCGDIVDGSKSAAVSRSSSVGKSEKINQRSFYKPIVQDQDDLENTQGSKIVPITVYLYPNLNPKFNYTTINVNVTSKINDILVRYCKMKNLDPNEYLLKVVDKMSTYDLNDTVLKLDGNYSVELISKKEAREKRLEKLKADTSMPVLPTIQSSDMTPLTIDRGGKSFLKGKNEDKTSEVKATKSKKSSSKYKLSLAKQTSSSSNQSANGLGIGNGNMHTIGGSNALTSGANSLFKSKNSSRSSLHGPLQFYNINRSQTNIDVKAGPSKPLSVDDSTTNNSANNFQDLFSGAYHRYKVWRRQQMSFINKHERTLALDGDYIYIVPPEGRMHWHENVKTKSLHISQVILVKKSKSAPENFKIYVKKSHDDIKRYYFEAASAQECTEIVTRLQNLMNAYKMNLK